MDKKDLYREIGNIDDDLILEAESKIKSKIIKKFVGFAACFAILIGCAYGLNISRDMTIGKKPDTSQSGGDIFVDEDSLTLNRATGETAYSIHIQGHFWADLTEAEVSDLYKGLAEKYPITATVDYSKVGEAISVFQTTAQVVVNDHITAEVIIAPLEVTNCYVLEGEPVLSEFQGVLVNAGYFKGTNNGKIIYYADFKIEEVAYYIEFLGEKGDEEILNELVYRIISGGKADFSVLNPIPPKELRYDRVTLEEAYKDKDFGAFIPENFPRGYSFNEGQRFINQVNNYLMVSLSKGYEDIMWQASFIEEEDRPRITSVEDRENYNLELYPIPTAESVPKELSEIVENPIFLIDELTLDAVKMRSYTIEDKGDTQGERMRFSVLYGDVLVEVNTKGVTTTELYEMLMSLK